MGNENRIGAKRKSKSAIIWITAHVLREYVGIWLRKPTKWSDDIHNYLCDPISNDPVIVCASLIRSRLGKIPKYGSKQIIKARVRFELLAGGKTDH
jgi:hypothetical protein